MIKPIGHNVPVVISLKVIVDKVSQLSVAVALQVSIGSVLSEQSIAILGGHVIKGARVSTTVII